MPGSTMSTHPPAVPEAAPDSVRLRDVGKVYEKGKRAVTALAGVEIGFRKGSAGVPNSSPGPGRSTPGGAGGFAPWIPMAKPSAPI
jgi:hypothetical protein